MKKIAWSSTRTIILDVFLSFGLYSIVLFIAAAYDKDNNAWTLAWILAGGAIVSLVIGFAISIIDYRCEHKKCKKLKYVSPQVMLKEDIVV